METGRFIAGVAALAKISYGLGALLAPDWMSRVELAPDVRGHDDGRMCLRGFGGYALGVGAVTLATVLRHRDVRPLLALNLATDTADSCVGLLEWRDRGRPDKAAVGGIAVPGAGIAAWLAAWRLGAD